MPGHRSVNGGQLGTTERQLTTHHTGLSLPKAPQAGLPQPTDATGSHCRLAPERHNPASLFDIHDRASRMNEHWYRRRGRYRTIDPRVRVLVSGALCCKWTNKTSREVMGSYEMCRLLVLAALFSATLCPCALVRPGLLSTIVCSGG